MYKCVCVCVGEGKGCFKLYSRIGLDNCWWCWYCVCVRMVDRVAIRSFFSSSHLFGVVDRFGRESS